MELTDLDEEILDVLREGNATQGYLVDRLGEQRFRIHKRLQLLAAAGHVERVHEPTALYTLGDDPAEEDDNGA